MPAPTFPLQDSGACLDDESHPVPRDDSLLDDGLLGDARGGRRLPSASPSWEVVRPLTADDLPRLSSNCPPALRGSNSPAPRQTLSQIRHSHHQLAQLLARGTAQVEASLITGYSQSYISIIKSDPTFCELLAHYATQQEQRFVDVLERLRVLGLSSIDELQSRLESEPDGWTKRELMELAELTLIKPAAAGRAGLAASGNIAGGGTNINIQFVSSAASAASDPSPVIDIEPSKP